MTLEQIDRIIPSRQYEIWRRLYTRYALEPLPALGSMAVVGTVVVPTTDADALLARHRGIQTVTAISGAGVATVHLVPVDTRRHLVAVNIFQTSGTFDFDDIILLDTTEGKNIAIDAFTAATSRVLPAQTSAPVLDPGDEIKITVVNFVGAGNVRCDVWVTDEDFF